MKLWRFLNLTIPREYRERRHIHISRRSRLRQIFVNIRVRTSRTPQLSPSWFCSSRSLNFQHPWIILEVLSLPSLELVDRYEFHNQDLHNKSWHDNRRTKHCVNIDNKFSLPIYLLHCDGNFARGFKIIDRFKQVEFVGFVLLEGRERNIGDLSKQRYRLRG